MKMLHVFPATVKNPKHLYAGSTKDIRGRTEYLQNRNIQCDELVVADRSDESLMWELKKHNLSDYSHVLIEFTLYPRSIRVLKYGMPHIAVLVRPHNAEFYHRMHYVFCSVRRGDQRPRQAIKNILEGISRLKLDYVCGAEADRIFSITRWETENYWRWLVHPARVATLPYYVPAAYASRIALRNNQKRQLCVCLMSDGEIQSCFLVDAATNYARLVNQLNGNLPRWEFVTTGSYGPSATSTRVRFTDRLDSPYDILTEAKAVAVLTNYGYGFKTKLLDAICTGCYVLVPPRLYTRLPEEIRPYCRIVHLDSVESFMYALETTNQPFPEIDVNETLRSQAYQALDQVLSA